ncbi:MAG: PAS domain-containing protein, partial [Thiotrichaceae bacterium]|nr:PAS domain-containing protein [Thiotrichaceae bacterium]
ALSENNWDKAEKELLAITDDPSITQLFLISRNGQIIFANKRSLKNSRYNDQQVQSYYKNNMMKPFIKSINDKKIVAIYPVSSAHEGGEFRSHIPGVLYLNYNLKSINAQYQSILYRDIWILFILMILMLIGINMVLHLFVVRPIESLSYAIRQERKPDAPMSIKIKGKGEIAILTSEFNKREQLICRQFKQIKENEALLQRAQEITHVGIYKRELQSNEMIWSDEMYRILELNKNTTKTTYNVYKDCIHSSDRKRYSTLQNSLIAKHSPYQIEYKIVRPDKSIRVIREQGEIKEAPEKNQLNLVSVIQDITEQEQTKSFIESSPAVIFRWKAEENWPVDFVTENISQFGYTRQDFISNQVKYNNIIYPEDRDKVTQEVSQYSKENKDHFIQEYRIITHDGDIRWIDDRTTIERNASGEVLYYTGIILDITHTKQIESEHQALGVIVSNSLNEIYIFDKESLQFTYINDSAEKNIGYSLNEMMHMTPIDIAPQISAEQFLSVIKPLEDESQKEIVLETSFRRKNRKDYFAEIHLQLMTYKEREQYIATVLDVSAYRFKHGNQ